MALFIPQLRAHGHLESVHFTVAIVGSRKILQSDDYGSGAWSLLAPNLTIYGFDADADACEASNADLAQRSIAWTEHHIPLALAATVGEATLYVTQHPSLSSLYPPNQALADRLVAAENIKLDFTIEIETTTIDEFCRSEGISSLDFLQVDVQGADLDVLQGAIQTLDRTLGVQVEVEFSPLYLNQPLFGDVDRYLRDRHFSLFDLLMDNEWCRNTRVCSPVRSSRRNGQLLWADACYLRDPIATQANFWAHEPQQLLKLACLADVLDFPDYAIELLTHLTLHHGNDPAFDCARSIVESLAQLPELAQSLESLPVVIQLRDRSH